MIREIHIQPEILTHIPGKQKRFVNSPHVQGCVSRKLVRPLGELLTTPIKFENVHQSASNYISRYNPGAILSCVPRK